MATKQVIFKLGEEEYGMDITLVNAIENYTGVVPIPNAPAYILGILNLRGEVIPVYSLRKKFGMPETGPTESTQLLIARKDGMAVAYKVDSVSEILEVADSEFQEIPTIVKNVDTRYAVGVVNKKDRLIVLLDSENILNVSESEAVKQVRADMTSK
ncbi:MAG: purine-binding chemotaxis protein CheW [Lachnospiraceae bacterium]|nr:purine-binding chemotaxis protein CheW [Lachnospiraceae bacterium]